MDIQQKLISWGDFLSQMDMDDDLADVSESIQSQLIAIVSWANKAQLDIYPVDIEKQFRIGRRSLQAQKADANFKSIQIQNSKIKLDGDDFSHEILDDLTPALKNFSEANEIDRESYWPIDYRNSMATKDSRNTSNLDEDMHQLMSSLNKILYGPPGTGKTYHTIEAAVKAAEPNFTWETREELKKEHQSLVEKNRIRFVTFHQSYGYEEFVEGLKASTNENDQITYAVEDGIFKNIVSDATKYRINKDVKEDEDFDSLWDKFLEQLTEEENGIRIKTKRTTFIVTDISSNTIRFEKSQGDSVHSLSIKTLKAIFDGERVIKGGLNPYYSGIVNYLKELSNKSKLVKTERKNFVLVVDEINRGNISKIFGELITLIEPSKRKGEDEALELTLPYSGESFSVPNNLHIIGTMNTADRSLAMMDTALRRRFDFVEMMPKPELLTDVIVNGIDLKELLIKLNERIAILYDREHTLGHAFFMPVKELYSNGKEGLAFKELQTVFKNKIIPLLEEYFFEDWSKIRLVLADNQKALDFQFITEEVQTLQQLKNLFGSNHKLDEYGQSVVNYRLADDNKSVWSDPRAYIGIYSPKLVEAVDVQERASAETHGEESQ
ncbi:McrB family protein [Vibrio hibernica]|uniref:McrB family protein n=1 Tax=Vibrio hibernica TaxID=2587465 RepID=UPI001E560125|nr:AAA family ATPase [Vibrio hibernica]